MIGSHRIVTEFVERIEGLEVVKEEYNPDPEWLPRREGGNALMAALTVCCFLN